jgi:hypothetical protein
MVADHQGSRDQGRVRKDEEVAALAIAILRLGRGPLWVIFDSHRRPPHVSSSPDRVCLVTNVTEHANSKSDMIFE